MFDLFRIISFSCREIASKQTGRNYGVMNIMQNFLSHLFSDTLTSEYVNILVHQNVKIFLQDTRDLGNLCNFYPAPGRGTGYCNRAISLFVCLFVYFFVCFFVSNITRARYVAHCFSLVMSHLSAL